MKTPLMENKADKAAWSKPCKTYMKTISFVPSALSALFSLKGFDAAIRIMSSLVTTDKNGPRKLQGAKENVSAVH